MSFQASRTNSLHKLALKRLSNRKSLERLHKKAKPKQYDAPPLIGFLERTHIKTLHDPLRDSAPFTLWDFQHPVAEKFESDDLVVVLKARQLGISWLALGFILRECVTKVSEAVLLSKRQDDADELIKRIVFMYRRHSDVDEMPKLVKANTTFLEWDNGSVVRALPAKEDTGRSLTASIVLADEFAFMQWPDKTLSAVKPIIDNGGKMLIVSTADSNGSYFHGFWTQAMGGKNGYTPIFLPWHVHPMRDKDWRNRKIAESGDERTTKREYPESDVEAFAMAAGLVYDVFSPEENVTEFAEFIDGQGDVYWGVDDGYSAGAKFANGKDPITGTFAKDARPRAFLLAQLRPNGQLAVFDEDYRVLTLEDEHLEDVMELGYPWPTFAAVDSAAAQLRGRMSVTGINNIGGTHTVEDGIKEVRRWLAPDKNGFRRLIIHPRCRHLRYELLSYIYDDKGKPVKAFDHGLDALRYLIWKLRYE